MMERQQLLMEPNRMEMQIGEYAQTVSSLIISIIIYIYIKFIN